MDEFLAFLFAGLIIIAALLVVFTGNIDFLAAPGSSSTVMGNNNGSTNGGVFQTVGFSENIDEKGIIVGSMNIEDINDMEFSLGISNNSEVVTANLEGGKFYNGLLFGSNSTKYHINKNGMRKAGISFTVISTNDYGPLLFKINNRIVKEGRYLPGEHFITIEDLPDNIDMEIVAGSSYWKMWAPNIYELSNVQAVFTSFDSRSENYDFFITENQFSSFRQGRIEFNLDENIGNIIVELNGKTLHNGAVADLQTINIDKNDLIKGDNSLRISGDKDSVFSGKARVLIFSTSEKRSIVNVAFNITQKQHTNMTDGRITFEINDIEEPGALSASIIWDGNELLKDYTSVEERKYTLNFDRNSIAVGQNKLIIEALDNAVFAVKGIKLEIR